MSKILAFFLLALALPTDAPMETVWLENQRMLSCSPSRIYHTDVLTLDLGSEHGRELGVRRHSDDTWYFLVVGGPPAKSRTLMTPETFQTKTLVEIPASTMISEWTTGEVVPIFSTSGKYSFYVSDNLESEAGGYMCTIEYIAQHGP